MSYTEDFPWINVHPSSKFFHLILHLGPIFLYFGRIFWAQKLVEIIDLHNEVSLPDPMLDIV